MQCKCRGAKTVVVVMCAIMTVAVFLGWCTCGLDARHTAHYHNVFLLPMLSTRCRKDDAMHQMGYWHPSLTVRVRHMTYVTCVM
jgi:hypothetical protein